MQLPNTTPAASPAPDPKTGATHPMQPQLQLATVSIRAPIRRPGRPERSLLRATAVVFQSAPRSEDRGDGLRTLARKLTQKGFNPRPDPKTGATGTYEVTAYVL